MYKNKIVQKKYIISKHDVYLNNSIHIDKTTCYQYARETSSP